jgi:site-specific DNA-methyltransferase (cytosine-N4-specific)
MHQTDRPAQARLTHLSRLHPYPAMVADELALDLASEYIPTGGSILDPFCGSGRLLAAANCASVRVGVDSNPLAWLLTRAKLSPARTKVIGEILGDFSRVRKVRPTRHLKTSVHGTVDWFAPDIVRDLERVIAWLNGLRLAESELFLAASALSATVREVSFARQNGWKLHRLIPSLDDHDR